MVRGSFLATVAAGLTALLAAGAPAAADPPARPAFSSVDLSFYSYVHPADAARMAQGGIRTLRYSFDWFGVEATEGVYRWTKLDRIVGNLAAAGIRSLPVLYGTPSWAVPGLPPNPFAREATRAGPGAVALAIPSGDDTAYPPLLTPEATAGWKRFLAAAAARYGPGGSYWADGYESTHPGARPMPIRTWQVWNEPNIAGAFWPRPRPRLYARLVRASAIAIRSVDPGARIALAGVPGRVDYRGVRFIDRVYRLPHIRRYFDLVGFHPYAATIAGAIDQLLHLRRALRREGDPRVPLFVSEIGWGSGKRDRRHFNEGPRGQARMLQRLFSVLGRDRRRLRIWRVSWFDWRDPRLNDPNCEWCGRSGLVDWRGRPKPAWRAYRGFVSPPRRRG
jgi:hypothetical protein